jgi:hypothetical protein
MLNESEQKIISEGLLRLGTGKFTLMTICGDGWNKVKNPTATGKAFKKLVINGHFPGVVFEDKKSNNHSTYIVEKR